MSDIIDGISERTIYFTGLLVNNSLVIGAKALEIKFISEYQAHGLL